MLSNRGTQSPGVAKMPSTVSGEHVLRNAQVFCAACVQTPAAGTAGTSKTGASGGPASSMGPASVPLGAAAASPASEEGEDSAGSPDVEPQPIAAAVAVSTEHRK